ncbi:beta-ketoacyl synthase (plasmid) [Fischerella sp. NIES-4106]|nr:beta-ketoacyl synthase [Fischerella sp. NIES-4106]
MDKSQDFVAIIGIACRFSGAKDYHQFWDNLEQGINPIGRNIGQIKFAINEPAEGFHKSHIQ